MRAVETIIWSSPDAATASLNENFNVEIHFASGPGWFDCGFYINESEAVTLAEDLLAGTKSPPNWLPSGTVDAARVVRSQW